MKIILKEVRHVGFFKKAGKFVQKETKNYMKEKAKQKKKERKAGK